MELGSPRSPRFDFGYVGRERPPRTRAFFWPWTSPTVTPWRWSEPNAIGLQLLQIPGLDTSGREADASMVEWWWFGRSTINLSKMRTDGQRRGRKHSRNTTTSSPRRIPLPKGTRSPYQFRYWHWIGLRNVLKWCPVTSSVDMDAISRRIGPADRPPAFCS